jgi:hypothetical protein
MRLDYKLAILKSGRYQFEIAHAAGLSEHDDSATPQERHHHFGGEGEGRTRTGVLQCAGLACRESNAPEAGYRWRARVVLCPRRATAG